MNQETAIRRFHQWDREQGHYVYTLHDLAKLFPEDGHKTLRASINRLIRTDLLERVCRGVYVYPLACSRNAHIIEQVARTLRRGEYSYISLESALSEHGAISQVPVDRITIMTTGREGEYRTPYGVIEFTHTKRSRNTLRDGVKDVGRPLPLATSAAAWRDLKRVGRNTHLVNERALCDA